MKKASALGLALLCASLPCGAGAAPVGARWADATDPVAKHLIEQERDWATDSCTPNGVLAGLIADDFVGTSPHAKLYTKSDLVHQHADPAATPERDCKLISARLRYFGPDVAVIYGRESAVIKGADGKDATRILVWTDTVLRRGGKWQVIAVQDMVAKPD